MSGEAAAACSKTVPLAEHEILKAKYESLMRDHESLTKTLEQREAEAETEKWKICEMVKQLETMEKDMEGLMLLHETGSATVAENLSSNNNTVSDKDVIMISDDDERESNGGDSNSSNDNSEPYFII